MVFLTLVILSFLHSDEIQRIEAVILEITQLRNNYKECKTELLLGKTQENQKINQELNKKIEKLEKIVKKQDELLKLKENMAKNQFPKLMMKKEFQKENLEKNSVIKFKATAFYLKEESVIYDAIDGKRIDKWEKNTSFTSNKKTSNWIQIGGYFVDKKWKSAKKEMWIKISQVSKKHLKECK
ncbi:MAG TPA: hypothetical protein CFH78_01600 [Sulfurimonas sp. UBA10385]|nr:MAG TPA: hypothetical protein CFH78_01600 [Sulfurimonas sp. UBA10385]